MCHACRFTPVILALGRLKQRPIRATQQNPVFKKTKQNNAQKVVKKNANYWIEEILREPPPRLFIKFFTIESFHNICRVKYTRKSHSQKS
jgi:hypothetical protein